MPQKPVTSNNFFPSQLLIHMLLHFQSQSQIQSLNGPFANTLSASCKTEKLVFENSYGVVKLLLLRDRVVVELSQLILSQTSTCK